MLNGAVFKLLKSCFFRTAVFSMSNALAQEPLLPTRESRPLHELKFVLVKCEWVLENDVLKWRSHSISGHVKE